MSGAKIPVGQCYPWAFAATARLPDARLVHGRVRDPVTGKRYGHAWIENEGQVLDWQTMEIGLGSHPFIGFPVELFYDRYRPTSLQSFTLEEALAVRRVTGHCGPWTAKERRLGRAEWKKRWRKSQI